MEYRFFKAVPKYLNCSTRSKDLLPILYCDFVLHSDLGLCRTALLKCVFNTSCIYELDETGSEQYRTCEALEGTEFNAVDGDCRTSQHEKILGLY
jgi:hypothetical protein